MGSVEILAGTGDVYAGSELLRTTRYRLEIATSASAAPLIEGTIDITGMAEATVLAGAPQLTLRLEDGRTLPFTLLNTSGRIRASGFAPSAS